jgi:hypothetical protein
MGLLLYRFYFKTLDLIVSGRRHQKFGLSLWTSNRMLDWLVVEGIPRERNPSQNSHQSHN